MRGGFRGGGTARRAVSSIAVLVVLVASSSVAGAAGVPGAPKIVPEVRDLLARTPQDGFATVLVHLAPQADLGALSGGRAERLEAVIRTLRSTALAAQADLNTWLSRERSRGSVSGFTPFWVFNGLSVTATPDAIRAIALRPEVERITPDTRLRLADGGPAPAEGNIAAVGAPELWAQGFDGEGVVVASMDTGVDVSHPDLAARWRGGDNGWFDPYGEHPENPVDVHGHGTWTMGVMVGGDAGGTTVGMAPGARWIAVKAFDDDGKGTVAAMHAGFQWVLDPDGDPATPDAPHVVNNSWTFGAPGCNLEFADDIAAMRAAGILPVFAAGNGGPGSATSYSPANNPGALAVGATDGSDVIWGRSSRGPSACEPEATFPDVVAPGVGVRTTDLYGGYIDVGGTSIAAPHASGGLALLLDAAGSMTAQEQEALLTGTAVDLGATGADPAYGNGRIDVAWAYRWALADLFLSTEGRVALGRLTARDEDLLADVGAGLLLAFDGSDVGLGPADVDAFAFEDARTLLLSLDRPLVVDGLGEVDDSDVVRFLAASLGPNSSGSFSMYFDGSDVGLETDAEDVDAVDALGARLVLSTRGRADAGSVRARGHDLLALDPTSLGAATAGSFSMYFDGSDVGLTEASERADAATAGGELLLSTAGAFAVPGLSGGGADVFVCVPGSLGRTTTCSFEPFAAFDPVAEGIGGVDAIDA